MTTDRLAGTIAKIAVVLAGIWLSACAGPPKPGEAAIPDGARVTHRAVLIGESNHDAVGTVSLYQTREAGVLVFEPNFSLKAPKGAVVAFGRDGYEASARVAKLVRNAGRQSYLVPPRLKISGFNEIWLWHEKSGLPLGLGRLTPII